MPNVPASVGQELLNVPFPEMIESMAMAIAHGQMALDVNSVQTAQALATTMIPEGTVVVAIKETVDADGNVTASELQYNDKPMPLLVYGLNPTFYQFTEAIIEVRMAISMEVERASEVSFGKQTTFESSKKFSASVGTGGLTSLLVKASGSVEGTSKLASVTTMNAKYTSKYNFKEEGSSLLRTTLKPVPAPNRSVPKLTVQGPTPPTG